MDIVKRRPSEESCAVIFKLNIDCFHEIFEWLKLCDLISVARTCKRLQCIAGSFYQLNYSSKRIIAENGGGYAIYRYLDIFSNFIVKISISCNNTSLYQFIAENCKSLREIRLGDYISGESIECIKEILKEIKSLEMNECIISGDFYENILQYCPKLKSLSVKRSWKMRNKSILIGFDNSWMRRTYATLEMIELTDLYELQELREFLQKNVKVKTFSIDSTSFWENRMTLASSNIKLNNLALEFSSENITEPIHSLLNELYNRGSFERLHVYSMVNSQKHIDRVFSLPLLNSVQSLHGIFSRIDFSLENLLTLSILNTMEISNIDSLPSKLPNLERIYFAEASVNHVLPFIRSSAKLMTMKILRMVHPGGIYHRIRFPDLKQLNKERGKLTGARRVSIYVCERMMLASKWTEDKVHFRFIELRRFDSVEWNDFNSYFRHNGSKHYF